MTNCIVLTAINALHIAILFFLLSSFLSSFIDVVEAHSRWKCPPPRNAATDITFGSPCGDETNNFDSSEVVEISPGPMLVQWEEAVSHNGSPYRISLSQDGTDTELPVCIVLDHIPHNDNGNPNIDDTSTYTLYSMIIMIPDIACTKCSLHLANMRTADEGDLGAPNGSGCTDPDGTCQTVYHSCTVPFTIIGTTPRSEYTCTNTNPSNWPTKWMGDNGVMVSATTIGVYRRESGNWDDTSSFLLDVPAVYRTLDDTVTLCNSIIGSTPTPTPTNDSSIGFFASLLFILFNFFLRLFGLR